MAYGSRRAKFLPHLCIFLYICLYTALYVPHILVLALLFTTLHGTVYISFITKAKNTILGGQCVKSRILLSRGPNAGTLVTSHDSRATYICFLVLCVFCSATLMIKHSHMLCTYRKTKDSPTSISPFPRLPNSVTVNLSPFHFPTPNSTCLYPDR